MKESQIQTQILAWLRLQFPNAFICKVPMGSSLQRGGVRGKNPMAGFPDVMVLMPPMGGYIGIEIKVPGGKLNEAQVAAHAEIRRTGGTIIVAHSLEEVQEAMR